MAYAQTAYSLDAYPAYSAEPQREERKRLTAIPGGKARGQKSNTSSLVTLAKMAAIVVIVAAVLAIARIGITSATVATLMQSETLSAEISQARSTGTSLEMEQSVLVSQTALKNAIRQLHMVTPYSVGTITLEADAVATDAEGNLSLSSTMKNIIGTQE